MSWNPASGGGASIAAGTLAGRGAASGAGAYEAITLGANLSFSGTTLNAAAGGGVADGDKGDITVSGTGATWTIDAATVTLAKMADMATGSLFYRKTALAGAPEVQTLATLKTDLGLTGTNSGDQTTIVGITGTLAQFNTAVTDADLTPAARLISTTAPLAGGGALTGDLTLSISAATDAAAGSMSAQDKTRLGAAFTRYHSLLDCSGSHTAARAAGTYAMGQGDPLALTGVGTLYPLNTIYIAAADYPAAGTLAAKLRLRVGLYVNDVAPTGNYTIGLHPVTRPATSGGAGLNIFTVGAAVASSTVTITAPAADSSNIAVTAADFALPADGHYVIGVVTTAAVAASSHVHISALLQMRYA